MAEEAHEVFEYEEQVHQGNQRLITPQDYSVDNTDDELGQAPGGEDGDEGIGALGRIGIDGDGRDALRATIGGEHVYQTAGDGHQGQRREGPFGEGMSLISVGNFRG